MSIQTLNTDSSLGILYWGLAFRMIFALKDDGIAKDVSGQVLTAQILSEDHSVALTEPVVLSSTAPGAAWATGRIVVEIPASVTANGDQSRAVLAIYGEANGDKWGRFRPLSCKQGVANV